ncbi:30S ribosomal protein S20 [Candidatus Parcubacteria bacterium]|nr:MAG: 30S ribosomal protein S20 [Candidatus Parcubacteria bacterium]
MPIKKAAAKSLRQNKKNFQKNKLILSNLFFLIKKTEKSLAQGKKAEAGELMKKVIKAVDKAVQKNIIKKNTAARKKSHLAKKLHRLNPDDKKIK